jgi:transposase
LIKGTYKVTKGSYFHLRRDDEALARAGDWPRSTAGPLAEAIRCALARWPALTRFLDDGRIELDNNSVERKNHLFAGSDGGGVRWATICSLIVTAKLNNVEPFAWLRDVQQRMTDGHSASPP